jgi:hypothetical protein
MLNVKQRSSRYLNRWNGSPLTYVPWRPRFNRLQKFSMPLVWTRASTYASAWSTVSWA